MRSMPHRAGVIDAPFAAYLGVRRTPDATSATTPIMIQRLVDAPLVLGIIVGLVFGAANLVQTWLYPVEDDTVWVVLRFYGPMFFLWALASFCAVRRTGRWISGVAAGVIVALSTFSVFEVLVLTRVNLFLDELTSRPDWQ